eukprot:2071358-Amphidinium_carterae.2
MGVEGQFSDCQAWAFKETLVYQSTWADSTYENMGKRGATAKRVATAKPKCRLGANQLLHAYEVEGGASKGSSSALKRLLHEEYLWGRTLLCTYFCIVIAVLPLECM